MAPHFTSANQLHLLKYNTQYSFKYVSDNGTSGCHYLPTEWHFNWLSAPPPQLHFLKYNTQYPLKCVNVHNASVVAPNSATTSFILPLNGTSINSSANQLHLLQYKTQHPFKYVNVNSASVVVPNSAITSLTSTFNGT